ncbi:PAS domain-containing protein [candidate division KSB1 bacterium]|nr:PAS domain-containing protein [candidate division KSB1 bacterium]
MKLHHKYILFISLVILLFVGLSLQLLPDHKWLFLISELIVLIIVGYSVHLYQIFIRPINLITAGIESIKQRDFNTKFLKVGQSEIDQLIDVYNEMIEHLRDERLDKHEQQFFLEKLIKASPAGIIILDLDDNISLVNPAAESMLTLSKEVSTGKSLNQLNSNLAHSLAELKNNVPEIITLNGIQKYKCQKSHFIDRGFQHHFIIMEELSEEVIRMEKNAYGKVIRLMSHEVNNSIGAINSILNTFLHYSVQLPAEDQKDYNHALNVAIERNNNLNRFMANFADIIRLPDPRKKPTDLHELLRRIQILMGSECQKRNIRWNTQFESDTFVVQIDVEQFEQALLNIAKNAVEAIEKNGVITIVTHEKPETQLIIRDTGKGIPPEIQSQIFTPFFSTKRDGQGIGLTLIREILLNHGFLFSLEKSLDGYTEFQIRFNSKQHE